LLGPPKEFFDEIKRGQKSRETVPLKSTVFSTYKSKIYDSLYGKGVKGGDPYTRNNPSDLPNFWKYPWLVFLKLMPANLALQNKQNM